ncbi:MAG: NAD(P)/FAD-dependent oxidoreductase, partial [Bdellovibrionales bacterium]|nr:NAD(P)/FAD-dependent oxidoreductase [Bdellovibrionales bacterium]
MIVIVGTGPAALVAATLLVEAGVRPVVLEGKAAPGWRLLVAGSSGLNVAWECPPEELASHYPERSRELAECFREFGKDDWLSLLHSLRQETFLGTSRRHFLRSMKAAPLLQAWIRHLESKGAEFHYDEPIVDLIATDGGWKIHADSGRAWDCRFALLALGGGSWENPKWPTMLKKLGMEVKPFSPSNAGWHIEAPPEFFREAEGKPIKGVTLRTSLGSRTGELMITRYGLEGTPVYTLGTPGLAHLDLKPDLPESKLRERLASGSGPLQKRAKLSPGAWLLARHLAPSGVLENPARAAAILKNFPLTLTHSRPLSESISSRGGLSWDELGENLEARKHPGLFFAGEMVDWDAPTGGFLLTACASMGAKAARG